MEREEKRRDLRKEKRGRRKSGKEGNRLRGEEGLEDGKGRDIWKNGKVGMRGEKEEIQERKRGERRRINRRNLKGVI